MPMHQDPLLVACIDRHCPCNLLPERASPKNEQRGQLSGHHVTSPMTSSPWKILFSHNFGRSSHSWGQIEAVFDISIFLKWPPFWGRNKRFTESNTGSWIYQHNGHEHFRAFDRRWNIDEDIAISKFDLRCDLLTSSMTSWIWLYINIVIIMWYLCAGRLMMISLFVF